MKVKIALPCFTVDLNQLGTPMMIATYKCPGCGGWHLEVAEGNMSEFTPVDLTGGTGDDERFDTPDEAISAGMMIAEDRNGGNLNATEIKAEFSFLPIETDLDPAKLASIMAGLDELANTPCPDPGKGYLN